MRIYAKLVQSSAQREASIASQTANPDSWGLASIKPIMADRVGSFKAQNSVGLSPELLPLLGEEAMLEVTEVLEKYTTKAGVPAQEWRLKVNVLSTNQRVIDKALDACDFHEISFGAPAKKVEVDGNAVAALLGED